MLQNKNVESPNHICSDSDYDSTEEGGTNSSCNLDDVRELEVNLYIS